MTRRNVNAKETICIGWSRRLSPSTSRVYSSRSFF